MWYLLLCSSKQNYDLEGVLGLSWAFGMPTFDIIRGTTIDYMHCVCEGVVQQLLNAWFSQDKKEELFHYPMYWLNRKVQGSEREWWRREWKGARFFFVTLPINPKIMFLMYNIIMVLKISRNGVIIPPMQTTVFGKVGLRFWELQMNMYSFTVYMYFLQVHSSWHTMSTSFCTWETQWKMLDHFGAIPAFFFEDLNGDFRDLFHGTQNIDAQVKCFTLKVVLRYCYVESTQKVAMIMCEVCLFVSAWKMILYYAMTKTCKQRSSYNYSIHCPWVLHSFRGKSNEHPFH